jgi:hypothetical protein
MRQVLTMSKPLGINHCIITFLAGFVAAMMFHMGIASGDQQAAALSAPTIEHLDGNHRAGSLRLKQSGVMDSKALTTGASLPENELLLVSRQSCGVPLQHAPLSAIPLVGKGSEDGEWVLLAGLGWNKDTGFGAKGPILIETSAGQEPANWYFTVEMLFLPKGWWHVRASLAIDADELHDALAAPSPKFNPLQIGIAIDFDRGDKRPLVLNLGYGRMPLEGRVLAVPSDGAQPDEVLGETRVFSACLNIQW